jgi:hypothetical protein
MRRKVVLTAVMLLASVLVTATYAQQGGMGSQMPKAQPQTSSETPMPGGMCPMCSSGMCPMMGGMQGGTMPMMGMMGGSPSESPKMVQMRGEMLKAMGEIMMKYGKMMEGSGR